MNEKMKLELFEKMYELEELAEEPTFDGTDYVQQSEGAYKMLKVLGVDREYIQWSFEKDYGKQDK